MICPNCLGARRISGVTCFGCLGTGTTERRASPKIEIVGPAARVAAARQDRDTVQTLHDIAARLDAMTPGPAQTATIIFAIEAWLEIGDQGEAQAIARDFWRVLPDDVLRRAGAAEELAERARLRRRYMEPTPAPSPPDLDDLADDEVAYLWAEMPGGVQ